MNKMFLVLVLAFPICGIAQNPNPNPNPTITPNPVATPIPTSPSGRANTSARRSREFEVLERVDDARELEEENKRREEQTEKVKLAREIINDRYRKPTKKEMLLVVIDDELRNKYAEFLKQKDAGLIKLLNRGKCKTDINVVQASEDCLKNSIPGFGASYSFRINNYRVPNLADLSFAENSFLTVGQWVHGLLLNLGDVPLDSIGLETASVANTNNFSPATNLEMAKNIDSGLLNGLRFNKDTYLSMVPVRENTTYLLRSIAYRGEILKAANGLIYNELDYDKRKDVLVVFRVVHTDSEGNVTILWKQLATKDSPKIHNPKSETRDNDFVGKRNN